MAEKDYYKILGVDKNASKEDIRKAYKRLAKRYHPDLNKDSGAADRFKEINEAAAVLGDDKRRQQYDRFGTSADQFQGFQGFDSSDFGGFDFDDIFESFFGANPFFSGGRRGRQPRRRGANLQYELEITLEQAAKGATKKIKIPRMETCPKCNGLGAESESDIHRCETCNGSGYVKRATRTPFGMFSTSSPCPDCGGEGRVVKRRCSQC